MADNLTGQDFLKELSLKIRQMESKKLGETLIFRTRLSKTDIGARTNARIEAAQKKESFDETETNMEELESVPDDITTELLNREIEDILGI